MNRATRIVLVLSALAAGCSPDLRETTGPLIPSPNVAGRIVRDGVPVFDQKVKLERADSTWAEDRTDRDGVYGFVVADSGDWTVRLDSTRPDDFARVNYDFLLASSGAEARIPPLDLSRRGLGPSEPSADEGHPVPSLFDPLRFRWDQTDPPAVLEVRVYTQSFEPVWFSTETEGDRLDWNGLGNQGALRGRFAPAGAYRWRLVVDGPGALRMTTDWRDLVLEDDDEDEEENDLR